MLLLLVISVKVIDVRVYIPCSKFPFFRRWFIFLSHLSLGAKFSLNILDIDLVCNIFLSQMADKRLAKATAKDCVILLSGSS